ncbi:MAG TPA: ATP-binding protein [Fimbriimonadaceae bacterium]|nr:ATP-binding protein [Fimbriimonadaceae bacterium]
MHFPLPANEAARIDALHSYRILDTEPEQAYDDLVNLAKNICDTPIAVLSLVDRNRQWFKSKIGVKVRQTDRASSFCTHTILQDRVMIVRDAAQDPRFVSSHLVTGPPYIRFYAGAPLMTSSGLALGALCAIDKVPRDLSDGQIGALEALARQIVDQFELRLAGSYLMAAMAERDEAILELEAKNSELTNVLSSVQSILIGLDGGGKVRLWNPAAAETIGISAADAMGSPLTSLAIPWDDARIREAIGICRQSQQTVRLEGVPFAKRRRLGLVFNPMENQPYGPKSLLISGVDITADLEAKQFMQRQAALLSSIRLSTPWGFMVTDDRATQVLYTNEPLRSLWGLAPAPLVQPEAPLPLEPILAELTSAARHPDLVGWPQDIGKNCEEGLSDREIELRDGRTLREYSFCIRDDEGRNFGRLYLYEDITNVKRLAEEQIRRNEFESLLAGLSTEFINLDSSEICAGIAADLQQIGEFSDMDRASIYVLSDDGEAYELKHFWQRGAESPVTQARIPMKEATWLHEYFLRCEPVWVSSLDVLPPEAGFVRQLLEKVGLRSVIGIPFMCNRQLIGFMSFGVYAEDFEWTQDRVTPLLEIARVFTNAMVRKRSDDEIRRLAQRALGEFEQRLQAVIASAPVLLLVIELDGRIALWEGQAPRILESGGDPTGALIFERWAAMPRLREAAERALTGEMFSTQLDMDDVSLEARFRPLHDEAGQRIGAIGVITDVTESRQFETRLALAEKMQGIGQLAAGVAHEMNTPMQYISANTYFLRDSFQALGRLMARYENLLAAASQGLPVRRLSRQVEECAEEVEVDYLMREIPIAIEQSMSGIDHVTKIVSALKEYCHPGVNAHVDVDVNRIVGSTLAVTHNAWRFVAEVETQLDPNLRPIQGVTSEIVQAISNILINAADAVHDEIKSGRYEKGRITVQTRNVSSGIEIRIADNGPGIPASVRSRIFELFFTTKEVGKGTGQGLAISHRVIAEKHGGSIDVESKEGQGTTFVLRLPANSLASEAA